jgi:hypothetical protein
MRLVFLSSVSPTLLVRACMQAMWLGVAELRFPNLHDRDNAWQVRDRTLSPY